MPQISICNEKGRDATVASASVRSTLKVWYLDTESRQATSLRFIRGTLDRDYDTLLAKSGGVEAFTKELIEGDPEIDLETVGMTLRDTSRVYVNRQGRIAHAVSQVEIVRNPDGSERTRRAKKPQASNVTPESPLRWSGKRLPKNEVFNKFVMVSKLQIKHVNGLTYDFLYEMAKELEASQCMVALGTGPKGNQPLIIRRGSLPYRGFLEGRTKGNEYCLILHLSNLELKSIPKSEAEHVAGE